MTGSLLGLEESLCALFSRSLFFGIRSRRRHPPPSGLYLL